MNLLFLLLEPTLAFSFSNSHIFQYQYNHFVIGGYHAKHEAEVTSFTVSGFRCGFSYPGDLPCHRLDFVKFPNGSLLLPTIVEQTCAASFTTTHPFSRSAPEIYCVGGVIGSLKSPYMSRTIVAEDDRFIPLDFKGSSTLILLSSRFPSTTLSCSIFTNSTQMLVFGGRNSSNSVYAFNTDSPSLITELKPIDVNKAPPARFGACMARISNNSFIVLLGTSVETGKSLGDVWLGEIVGSAVSWTQKSSSPIPLSRSACLETNLKRYIPYVYVFGGINDIGMLENTMLGYDIRIDSWKMFRSAPAYISPRASASIACSSQICEDLVIVGGAVNLTELDSSEETFGIQ